LYACLIPRDTRIQYAFTSFQTWEVSGEAVFTACGWKSDLCDEEIIEKLLDSVGFDFLIPFNW